MPINEIKTVVEVYHACTDGMNVNIENEGNCDILTIFPLFYVIVIIIYFF